MCDVAVLEFFMEYAKPEEFRGKRVLEVGSKYVNGSVHPLMENFFSPREYVGVDIALPVEKLVDCLSRGSFDELSLQNYLNMLGVGDS